MEVTKTLKCQVLDYSKMLNDTLHIYRQALTFIVDVVYVEWENISILKPKHQLNSVESFIHMTNRNPFPKHNEFDTLFYKFPSYFRRSATAEAIGIVKSYTSNLQNYNKRLKEYQSQGKILKDKSPHLQKDHYAFPVFYKGNMFKQLDNHTAKIKVYKDNDWKWITINFKGDGLSHSRFNNYKISNPSLVKHGKKFSLHFAFIKEQKLKQTKLKDQIIVAVDLGLTNSAVCSVMRSDGTVIDGLFINQPIEKDRMNGKLNKLKKVQQASGRKNKFPNYWRKINNYQKQIVQDTTNKIVDFALKYNADVIVFEYLGKIKGNKNIKQKLHHWAKNRIQEKVTNKAHGEGIKVRRVNARNTSKLAYDGSGEVIRNNKKDVCTFTTGKKYHADLNASYNIGSRYFIKEYLKTFSKKKRLQVEAKVPSLVKRASCTLNSLINLNKVIQVQSICYAC